MQNLADVSYVSLPGIPQHLYLDIQYKDWDSSLILQKYRTDSPLTSAYPSSTDVFHHDKNLYGNSTQQNMKYVVVKLNRSD